MNDNFRIVARIIEKKRFNSDYQPSVVEFKAVDAVLVEMARLVMDTDKADGVARSLCGRKYSFVGYLSGGCHE